MVTPGCCHGEYKAPWWGPVRHTNQTNRNKDKIDLFAPLLPLFLHSPCTRAAMPIVNAKRDLLFKNLGRDYSMLCGCSARSGSGFCDYLRSLTHHCSHKLQPKQSLRTCASTSGSSLTT